MERKKGTREDIHPFGKNITLTEFPKELAKKVTLL